MDNDHDILFEWYFLEGTEQPRSLAEIIAAQPKLESAEERLQKIVADGERKPDWFETEAIVARERARRDFGIPEQPGLLTNAGKGGFDDLLHAFSVECEPESPLSKLLSPADLGRQALKPGPGLHLEEDPALSQVLTAVSERMPTAAGRDFAKQLATKAAEMEGVG